MACRRLGRAVDLGAFAASSGSPGNEAGDAPRRAPAPRIPPGPGPRARPPGGRPHRRGAGPVQRAAGAGPGQIPGVASGGGQPRPDPRGRGGAAASAQDPTDARPVTGRTVRLDGRAGPPRPAGAVTSGRGRSGDLGSGDRPHSSRGIQPRPLTSWPPPGNQLARDGHLLLETFLAPWNRSQPSAQGPRAEQLPRPETTRTQETRKSAMTKHEMTAHILAERRPGGDVGGDLKGGVFA